MSTDSRFVHQMSQEQELSKMVKGGVPFPMLSDAGGEIGKAYGVYDEAAAATIRDSLLEKCYLEYRSILCKDIQRKYFGKVWNLTGDEMAHEFLGITHGCIIMQTAKWATECILDEFEKGNVKGV